MWNFFTVIILAAIAGTAAAVVVVYSVLYRRSINKRLSDPQSGRRMWSPLRVCIVTVITALAVFAMIAGTIASHNPPVSTGGAYAAVYRPEDGENQYLRVYSIERNSGYAKHVQRIGDVKYTYFISEETYDSCHPAFLIYAEQIGNAKRSYCDANCSFQAMDGKEFYSVSASEEKNEPFLCLAGNAPVDCKISCVVEYYNQKKKEMAFDQLRAENRALTFVLSNHE